MWRRALITRVQGIVSRKSSAFLHTSSRPKRLLDSQLSRYCAEFSAKHKDPAFPLVDALTSARDVADFGSQLTGHDDRGTWLRAATAPDISEAVKELETHGIYVSDPLAYEVNQSRQLPTWLVLHLLRNKFNSSEQAPHALDLLYSHIPAALPHMQHCLLFITAYWSAQYGVLAALRRIIHTFIHLPDVAPDYQYNAMLEALAVMPASEESSLLATSLIQAMTTHAYAITNQTYAELLRDKFLTMTLLHAVQRKAEIDGYTIQTHQLKAILRLYARHGRRKKAGAVLDVLSRRARAETDKPVPLGRHPVHHALDRIQLTRLNTQYFTSFRDWSALSKHIDRISKLERRPPISARNRTARTASRTTAARDGESPVGLVSVSSSDTTSQLHQVAVQNSESSVGSPSACSSDSSSQRSQVPSSERPLPQHQDRRPMCEVAENSLDISDWAAILLVGARDKSVSATSLRAAFEDGIAKSGFRPNLFAYSTVVRGLLRKWDVAGAAKLWHEARSHSFPLHTISIGIGVSALTLNGEPDKAFALLEEAYACSKVSSGRHKHQIRVNIQAVNQFMVALQRMGRPDAVFQLWDNLKDLYRLEPDVYTMNIVMKTARWAKKLDNSLRGHFAQLGLGRLLHRESTADASSSREEIAAKLAIMLEPKWQPRRGGLWNGKPAQQVALQIVSQVFFGNWPDLRAVQLPVRATRSSASSPAFSPVSDFIHSVMGPGADIQQNSTLLLSPSPAALKYPQIVPTDLTFREIIDLLGAESLQTEIPRVLAWMRALKVQPSKDTLAVALVLYAEVGLDAPLIERMKGGPSRSPYSQLKRWMADWVGDKNMPGDRAIGRELSRLSYYREAPYEEIIKDRWERTGRHGHR